MKHQKLSEAMNEISDAHITEAAAAKKKHRLPWIGAIAAVLAIVLILRGVDIPMAIHAKALATASDSRALDRPDYDSYKDREQWNKDFDAYLAQQKGWQATANQATADLADFFTASAAQFLSGAEGNMLYSPINAYMGLAMAAEIAGGNTQSQLLSLLGVPDIATLRSHVSAIWETVYNNDSNEICTLANSLWVDDETDFKQQTADDLAYHYYSSIYRQDLSSARAAKDIAAWLNNHTGGLLKDAAGNIQLPKETVFSLYSTIYFQSKWYEQFDPAKNTRKDFHAPEGDVLSTFMNFKELHEYYYWGESYGAVSLGLKNGSQMWLILPDEDKTVDHVLAQGEYLQMMADPYEGWENSKYMKVNLSMPKFDVQSQTDLAQGLKKLGITDAFDPSAADFSNATDGMAYLSSVNQAVRVIADEDGVKAASYIELPMAGAAAPPNEVIDFVLDRPFLFVITKSGGIPLFTGVVNNPS